MRAEKWTRKATRRVSATLLLLVAVTGLPCPVPTQKVWPIVHAQVSADDGTVDDASSEDMFLHTVQWPGETLSLIAEWYTGDPSNWTILSDFNAGHGSDAVRANEVILIPKFLLTTTTPMPRTFVGLPPQQERPRLPRKTVHRPKRKPKPKVQKKAHQSPAPEPAPEPATEPLELFGPKE
jgi:hypothetical protein